MDATIYACSGVNVAGMLILCKLLETINLICQFKGIINSSIIRIPANYLTEMGSAKALTFSKYEPVCGGCNE